MAYTDFIDAVKKYEAELAKCISEYETFHAKCVEYANFLNSKYSDFINKNVRITWCGHSLSCFFNGFKVKEGLLGTHTFSEVQMDICLKKMMDGFIA